MRDFTGRRFGQWIVVGEANPTIRVNGKKRRRWLCKCDCGTKRIVDQSNLVTHDSTSCGCRRVAKLIERCRTHNCANYGAPTVEYRAWQAMWNRCTNPNYESFHHYGGRGIRVCRRWKRFENFLSDMGLRPADKHTLDRKDTNGHYCPSNCRWATWTEQQNNRRTL